MRQREDIRIASGRTRNRPSPYAWRSAPLPYSRDLSIRQRRLQQWLHQRVTLHRRAHGDSGCRVQPQASENRTFPESAAAVGDVQLFDELVLSRLQRHGTEASPSSDHGRTRRQEDKVNNKDQIATASSQKIINTEPHRPRVLTSLSEGSYREDLNTQENVLGFSQIRAKTYRELTAREALSASEQEGGCRK